MYEVELEVMCLTIYMIIQDYIEHKTNMNQHIDSVTLTVESCTIHSVKRNKWCSINVFILLLVEESFTRVGRVGV